MTRPTPGQATLLRLTIPPDQARHLYPYRDGPHILVPAWDERPLQPPRHFDAPEVVAAWARSNGNAIVPLSALDTPLCIFGKLAARKLREAAAPFMTTLRRVVRIQYKKPD